MDVSDVRAESEHCVEGDAKDLGGVVERGRDAGNWDLWMVAILVGPEGEKGDVGLGGHNDEVAGGDPILNGGEVGGQRVLQLLKDGRGADRRQVVCIGHCERGALGSRRGRS